MTMDIDTALRTLPGRPLAEYQIADVKTMVANNGQALYAGCLGSRKTATGVATMAVVGGVWLVVAPLHTLSQWEEALAEWAPHATISRINNKNRTGLIDLKEDAAEGDGLHVHLIGWEYMRLQDWKLFKNITGSILDEVHRMAGHGTLTAKAVWKINTQYRIGLSGTPARNKLHALYNVLRWIWWGNKDARTAEQYRRFELFQGTAGVDDQRAWLRRHFHVFPNRYHTGPGESIEIGPAKYERSVIDEIPCYIQHLEEERCCEFHPQGVNATLPEQAEPIEIYVDMAPAQAKMYKQLEDGKLAIWTENQDGEREAVVIANDMVNRLRKRQIALGACTVQNGQLIMPDDVKSSKIDMLVDLLQDIVEPGDPVLVFTHSKIATHAATARINKVDGLRAEAWTGDLSSTERESLKQRFGTDGGPNVMVATIRSIGEGTDGLQKVARREVWLSWEEDDVFNKQAAGRLRRGGQTRRNQRWEIITRDTIEQEVIETKKAERAALERSLKA